MFCRTCAKELPATAIACIQCGCPPAIGNKYCQDCGAETLENAIMCVKCGSGLRRGGTGSYPGQSQGIQKSTLCIFALLLGGGGGHKFYSGNWGWGILYLIFCWTFIPGIIAIVELIRYLTLDETSIQQAYQKVAGRPFGFLW